MWTCQHCEARIDNTFAACWNGGASIEGLIEPEFRHADDCQPDIPEYKRQFSLAELLIIATAIAVALAGWSTQNPALFFVGSSILGLMVLCSALPTQMHKWQTKHHKSRDDP